MPDKRNQPGSARRAYLNKLNRERMARNRTEFFAGKLCVACGSDENLQLDHIDPNKKINHRIWSWTKHRREEELSKCQVLCSPCHLIKTISQTHETMGWRSYRHGTASMYRKGCKCGLCKLWRRNVYRERERA